MGPVRALSRRAAWLECAAESVTQGGYRHEVQQTSGRQRRGDGRAALPEDGMKNRQSSE